MIDNSELWNRRAKELLLIQPKRSGSNPGSGAEATQFAVSILSALHGPESPEVRQFRDGCTAVAKSHTSLAGDLDWNLWLYALGAIRNAKAQLDAGLTTRLRVVIAGEILAQMIALAKQVMDDRTEEAKNVGAVLSAAAYEGLVRKMGDEFAGVTDRRKLEEVITALKTADVLKGGQVGLAQSYLKFRNDSLHADWKNVDCSQIESCIAFTESLLLKHFS